MSEHLKPCPFCGCQPELLHFSGRHHVRCSSLACGFPWDNADKAIAAWNTRPAHDTLVEQVKALMAGWTVERMSLYDEEGIDGWKWIEPNGNEHIESGAWDELPPWPESASAALKAAGEPL